MFTPQVESLSIAVLDAARAKGLRVTTAESCTGGLVAAALTEIAGSSDVFGQGFVTYSNAAKVAALGLDAAMVEANGAVSEPVARAMAEGALRMSGADAAVAVTGIAGPGGGSAQKPVGLVHFATARKDGATLHREMRFGDLGRSQVRQESLKTALEMLAAALD